MTAACRAAGSCRGRRCLRRCAEAPAPCGLMLETYNTGPGDLGFSRGIFQDLCPDPEAFVRQGVAFLKRQIQPANPPHA